MNFACRCQFASLVAVSTESAITTTRDTRLFALPCDVAWKVTVVAIRCGSCGLTDEPVSSWYFCGSSACDLGSYSDERCIRILNGLVAPSFMTAYRDTIADVLFQEVVDSAVEVDRTGVRWRRIGECVGDESLSANNDRMADSWLIGSLA